MPANWISRGTVLVQLGRHHFAFFRGYLDGLDLRQLSERYIETNAAHFTEIETGAAMICITSLAEFLDGEQTLTPANRRR